MRKLFKKTMALILTSAMAITGAVSFTPEATKTAKAAATYNAYSSFQIWNTFAARDICVEPKQGVTSSLPFMNFKFFEYADELQNAVLIVHCDKAHSYYFGKDTFEKLRGDNKQMLTVKDASHCDLYDNLEKIPFEEIAAFYTQYLK